MENFRVKQIFTGIENEWMAWVVCKAAQSRENDLYFSIVTILPLSIESSNDQVRHMHDTHETRASDRASEQASVRCKM